MSEESERPCNHANGEQSGRKATRPYLTDAEAREIADAILAGEPFPTDCRRVKDMMKILRSIRQKYRAAWERVDEALRETKTEAQASRLTERDNRVLQAQVSAEKDTTREVERRKEQAELRVQLLGLRDTLRELEVPIEGQRRVLAHLANAREVDWLLSIRKLPALGTAPAS
jgi:hypothetical protein